MAKLIVANWKMNPSTEREALDLFRKTINDAPPSTKILVAPTFIHLESIAKIKRPENVSLCAQNLFWEEEGAYTGEISGLQLKGLGIKYAIVGHSERRLNLSETDEMVSKKMVATRKSAITPILCVGEKPEEKNLKEEVVTREIKTGFSRLDGDEEIIIAYEPIWAIGTGISDKPEDTLETFALIRKIIKGFNKNFKVKLIYGGSVSSENIESFIKHKEIEGVLVGRASLSPDEFKKILNVAATF